jgi:hypothetical protein
MELAVFDVFSAEFILGNECIQKIIDENINIIIEKIKKSVLIPDGLIDGILEFDIFYELTSYSGINIGFTETMSSQEFISGMIDHDKSINGDYMSSSINIFNNDFRRMDKYVKENMSFILWSIEEINYPDTVKNVMFYMIRQYIMYLFFSNRYDTLKLLKSSVLPNTTHDEKLEFKKHIANHIINYHIGNLLCESNTIDFFPLLVSKIKEITSMEELYLKEFWLFLKSLK